MQLNILLIEDDLDDIELLRDALLKQGVSYIMVGLLLSASF